MAKNRGHEQDVPLFFKNAYRPSYLRQESNSMVSPQVSPRGSQTNIAGMNQSPRPPVCSPPSLPLRQDAIFQSFPIPSPRRGSPRRGSPRRSSGARTKSSTRTPPLQNVQVYSPRPSPKPSPRVTPQTSPGEDSWESSRTESPTAQSSTPLGRYAQQTSATVPPLDGGSSLELLGGQNLNDFAIGEDSSRGPERDYHYPNEGSNSDLGKEAEVLGLSPHLPEESPRSSQSRGKKKPSRPRSGSSGDMRGTPVVPHDPQPTVKRRRTSGFLQFMRAPLTFPLRKQSGRGFIYNCIPVMSRKSSAVTDSVPTVPSPNELPNSRIPYNRQASHESLNTQKYSPPLKTPTPVNLSKISLESDSHRRHHGMSGWRHKKHKGADTSPGSFEAQNSLKQKEGPHLVDYDPAGCYVAGEAHRFRTPLESPRIPGTPPTPSAISPGTVEIKGKRPLPSYFDLRRREMANVSPSDRGFTLMPLSDPDLSGRTGAIQAQASRLPHFVKVPMFSHAAPFATRDDYKSYSAGTSPEATSRRSSFPPGPGWSSNRSSGSGGIDGRRASFGYRDHMNFITKPEGYSSRTGSSAKQESSSSSGSPSEKRRDSHNTMSDASRKSSLGERRASKVIAALNVSRKGSSEQRPEDEGIGSIHSSTSSSRLVHWRGAEVTEEEAKMLDMLVGKHRVFSEMLMAPLDKGQSERPERPSPEPSREEPVSVLRRPSWRRFASTIMSSPLSGLSEETASSDKTTKPDTADPGEEPDVPDLREMYAEALQETMGIPVGPTARNKKWHEDVTKPPSLPPSVIDKLTPKDFITGPPDVVRPTDTLPIDAPMTGSRSSRTTRTEFETEILSIAMLYGRVIQETTRAASEPSTPPPAGNTSAESTLRSRSRAPSLTVPERPSVGFITNALDERSVSDGLISDVRRVSLNPTSKSRRSSSTLARLHKLVGGGEKSKRDSTTSPFSSPPEYIEDNPSRHQSLNVPSLISALTRASSSGKEGSLGSMDGRKS
ncbi:hypothetical protein TWF730_005667 [Orbilia blumenaviensis]|uniref:Uncharacterized protein n=1 Tax=Orbilia blumenaviensis TaxID=1796055 RepID=A0AAV9VJ12_9PEZI